MGEEERDRERERLRRRREQLGEEAFTFASFKLICPLGLLATLYSKHWCVAGTC